MSTYEVLQKFVASFGLVYFGLIFVIALTYTLWPSKRGPFEDAARIPLRED